jgi:hypothetical protein
MPIDAWPEGGEMVAPVPLGSCVRPGAGIEVDADSTRAAIVVEATRLRVSDRLPVITD